MVHRTNQRLRPEAQLVRYDPDADVLIYGDDIRSDEARRRDGKPEELVRALAVCLLRSPYYGYEKSHLYIEKYFAHGSIGSARDEVDLIIFDSDDLPYAMWEFKDPEEYDRDADRIIEYQLFGTAPLLGAPRLLVYATIRPGAAGPTLVVKCIDKASFSSYEHWRESGSPFSDAFPSSFSGLTYEPFVKGGAKDLRFDCSQADFRDVAAAFHAEFFGEHPDNVLFTNLVKCLLAKIYDERSTPNNERYKFQVLVVMGREEDALTVFQRINDLYRLAYTRFIDPHSVEADEISTREFAPERVKTVVRTLESMSLTKGAALHGDIIGAFFEEILRSGFKQDKGMYFTHANLVDFMLQAIDLDGLTVAIWKGATHPENRLPYVIDPACGSGSFLLAAMKVITRAVRERGASMVTTLDDEEFAQAKMSDQKPNFWAENFLYGMDPKFVMAITAKVNMVLHGDGSAHIFKYDGLGPLAYFKDDRLKPLPDGQRSVARKRYRPDLCERFDVVVSNPPFGITLASETRASVSSAFEAGNAAPSEALFLERWFQLLKPKGRLGVVVPESLLNTADATDHRIFLYRFFWIRAIVAMPRNIFIETPTLTSLLFAQKKTAEAIADWDQRWDAEWAKIDAIIRDVQKYLSSARKAAGVSAENVQDTVLIKLRGLLGDDLRFLIKKGAGPINLDDGVPTSDAKDTIAFFRDVLSVASFKQLLRNHAFHRLCDQLDYDYLACRVEEVGYKLSKRKEKLRANQLALYLATGTPRERPNLHLANDAITLVVNVEEPRRVLDFIRRDVKWEV